MQILDLLGMYSDAVVVEVETCLLFCQIFAAETIPGRKLFVQILYCASSAKIPILRTKKQLKKAHLLHRQKRKKNLKE